MAGRKLRKVCTVCGGGYRTWAVHVGSSRHRRALSVRERSLAGPGFRRTRTRRRRDYEGEDHQRVNAHRRRLPLDGPRKVVKVRRYWRERSAGWATFLNSAGEYVRRRIHPSYR